MPCRCGTSRLRARSSNIAARPGMCVAGEELLVGLRGRFRLELGGDDVEHVLEMLVDFEPLEDGLCVLDRAVRQDQLAAGQPSIAAPSAGLGSSGEWSMSWTNRIIVGADAVLGHHAAHGCAVALVVLLLDAMGASSGILEILRDVVTDPGVDLLPQVDLARIQRVVEVEHPGVDMAEAAVCVLEKSSRQREAHGLAAAGKSTTAKPVAASPRRRSRPAR